MSANHSTTNTITWLNPEEIAPNRWQPRKRFAEEPLRDLADSIRAHGILQPLTVRPTPGFHQAYELIAGERRLRAAGIAGLQTVPCIIRGDLDDKASAELALVENLQRQDLDPIEEAEGYKQLQDLGYTQAQIGERVHRAQPTIANRLRLLQLPEPVRESISKGELTASHGIALCKHADRPLLVQALATTAAKADLPVAELEGAATTEGRMMESVMGEACECGQAQAIDYGTKFDRRVCETACPHGAYVAGQWNGYCLRPSHYEELQKAAIAEIERKQQAKAQSAVAANNGKAIPKLDKLPYDSYERIRETPPAGCSEDCKCRGQGLDWEGKIVPICTDPKCYKRLQIAQSKIEGKERRAALQAQLTEVLAALDGDDPDVLSRACALIAAKALAGARDSAQEAAGKRLPPECGDLAALMAKRGYERGHGAVQDALCKVSRGRMIRFAAECLIRQELAESAEYRRSSMPAAAFILSGAPVGLGVEPGDRVEARDIAGGDQWRRGTVVKCLPYENGGGCWVDVLDEANGQTFRTNIAQNRIRLIEETPAPAPAPANRAQLSSSLADGIPVDSTWYGIHAPDACMVVEAGPDSDGHYICVVDGARDRWTAEEIRRAFVPAEVAA